VSLRVFIRLVILGLIVFLSVGCATQYGCKGMPDDPKCLSTTEAYQVTDKALPEPSKPETQKIEAVKAVKVGAIAPFPRHARQPVPKIEDPTPIRTPAQVMRIWIAPWEDSDGDLMVSGYVYTELEPRRWMIGKSAPTVSTSLIPLQIEQRPPERPLDRDQAGSETEGMPPGPSKAPNTH
jgi:conjugal transfer pilus assembly protein TraV